MHYRGRNDPSVAPIPAAGVAEAWVGFGEEEEPQQQLEEPILEKDKTAEEVELVEVEEELQAVAQLLVAVAEEGVVEQTGQRTLLQKL